MKQELNNEKQELQSDSSHTSKKKNRSNKKYLVKYKKLHKKYRLQRNEMEKLQKKQIELDGVVNEVKRENFIYTCLIKKELLEERINQEKLQEILNIETSENLDLNLQNIIMLNLIQKIEKQNNFLKEQIKLFVSGKNNEIIDVVDKYFYLLHIVDNLKLKNDFYENIIKIKTDIINKLSFNITYNKSKKRKWFELNYKEADHLSFDMVHGIQSKSLKQMNEIYKKENEYLIGERNDLFDAIIPIINTFQYDACMIVSNLKNMQYVLDKKINILKNKISNLKNENKSYISCVDELKEKLKLKETHMEETIKNLQMNLEILNNELMIKNDENEKLKINHNNLIEQNKLEYESLMIKNEELTGKIEIFTEVLKELKDDMYEMEKENEELKEKLEEKSNENFEQ